MTPGSRVTKALALAVCVLLAGCSWPSRTATKRQSFSSIQDLPNYEGVRAIDGYPNPMFQASFNTALQQFAATKAKANGRRDFDMLALSSGGINGSFGAGILTAWSKRGDRPDFRFVTGVSVGALIAPFAFAGSAYDNRLEQLFRHIEQSDLFEPKGALTSVLWDESLTDNSPLRRQIERAVDHELLATIAERHRQGARLFVASTNLDVGHLCIWDLGAIATKATDAALELFRKVLLASAAIPVVFPPVRFAHADGDELHVDGAVIRPVFLPQNVFDGELAAEQANIRWEDVDATLYVIHNGSMRPSATTVQRDTLTIATRTVTMMSYTMVGEHILHLYTLTRVWGAEFRLYTMQPGSDLSLDNFGPEGTNRLFASGENKIESKEPWLTEPPGYVLNSDLSQIRPKYDTSAKFADSASGDSGSGDSGSGDSSSRKIEQRLTGIERQLEELQQTLRALLPTRAAAETGK